MKASMWRAFHIVGALIVSVAAAAAEGKIDAKAQELTRKLMSQFQSAKSAEADLKVVVKLQGPEAKAMPATYSLAVEKPNRIALVFKEGAIGASVYSDGTNGVTFIPMLKQYTVRPAPKNIGTIVMEAGATFGDVTGSMAFIAALFSPKPYEALLDGVTEGTYAGLEVIAGKEYQRLKFKQEGVSWSMLITPGDRPLLRRIEVDVSELPVNAESMTMEFSGWKFDEKIEAARFKFVPPDGARKVDALLDADSDLIGEKLPEFKLKGLDGKEWNSTEWKGQPVVLMFWAGEQKHAIGALKDLADLARDHKQLKVFTVNLDEVEDAAKVKGLLETHKVALPVALDSAHVVAEELEVDGVPMTFYVDKEGIVQNAWLGHHPDFKTLVAKEILRTK
jgi:peroxiredoxin